MPPRMDSDLRCRVAWTFLAEAGWFSVEAGSNWAFGVDVRTPLWIQRIGQHRDPDGNDSLLSSGLGGNRNRQQCRYVNQQNPRPEIAARKTSTSPEVIALEMSRPKAKYPAKSAGSSC